MVETVFQPEIGDLVFWEVPTNTTTMYMLGLYFNQLENGNSLVKVYQKDHQRYLEKEKMEVDSTILLKPISQLPLHIKSIL